MKSLILSLMMVGGIALNFSDYVEAMQPTNVQAEAEHIDREEVLVAIRSNNTDMIANLIGQGAEPDNRMLDVALEHFFILKENNMPWDMDPTLDTIKFLLKHFVYTDNVSLTYVIANNLIEVLPLLLQDIHENNTEWLLNEDLGNPYHDLVGNIIRDKHYRGSYTPLEMAIQENSIPMAEMLISNGATITVDCFTAAVSKNNPIMAQFLLDQVPQESWNEIALTQDSCGDFAMLLAAETGMDILMYMIELHQCIFPDIEMEDIINHTGEDGKTLINCSTYAHLNDVTRYLLENGAQDTIDVHDDNGKAPVDYAVQYEDIDLLYLLLENDATPTENALLYIEALNNDDDE